ncbi:Lpg1974 family pore-forming outer membrane protein [Botrimarina mediterranea]|uniref:Legionella pneumophila major outer membrane protein n=1 Tax=Botrimarina mediterranea TaxID=2528022 RepID=A0A518K531_9BACT|nr:Lpg1974 family pore-forming outer membrane protein [Botrimarina mediterranea]QDV72885.1 hypothetical protein Spa11_10690 [Botrimarina mediterranea]QDV77457.1 hypothetical protein K2D_10500 [Planctomycetes bacterium K2D]
MRRRYWRALLLAALTGTASAETLAVDTSGDIAVAAPEVGAALEVIDGASFEQACGVYGDACRRSDAVAFEAELLFFKFFRTDGVRAGAFSNVPPATTDDIEYNYSAVPRLTLGYQTASGLGARVRYFEFDESGKPIFPETGVQHSVDTYTIDFEVYDRFKINNDWALECSAGLRYAHFEERMDDPIPSDIRLNRLHGFGGVAAVEAVREISRSSSLFARTRGAIIQDDKYVRNGASEGVLRDSSVGMLELALGYQYAYQFKYSGRVSLRAGYEWQNWYNFSSAFSPFTTAPDNFASSFVGGSDVGFSGFTLQAGYEY